MSAKQMLHLDMESLIARELEINGVNLTKTPWLSSSSVIQEIIHILTSPIHEGQIVNTGVIFAENVSELKEARLFPFPLFAIDWVRKLANGVDHFLLYEKGQLYGLAYFPAPVTTELRLIQLFPISGGILVQRGITGVTKFFQGDSIILHENRVWSAKPHIKEAEWKIAQSVAGIDRTILRRVLEFAFHLVSPATRVGATFVWSLCPPDPPLALAMSDGQDLSGLTLSVSDEARSAAVCHLLSQIDGATFLDPLGKLISTEVQLKYSDRSRELIREFRGTRHTSAQRFSFDHENTLVVTVSEDGPVNVFLSGANIAGLKIQASYREARILKASSADQGALISNRSFEKKCENCGKNCKIDEIDASGLNEVREIFCPVCLSPLYQASCFSIDVRPFVRITKAS